jgi:hypothetical protein
MSEYPQELADTSGAEIHEIHHGIRTDGVAGLADMTLLLFDHLL